MSTPRDRELAQIHIARKALALTEDTYRALLMRVTGKDSAADLHIGERGRVLAEFRRLGWKPKPPTAGRQVPADAAQVRMLRGLWIELHNLGAVRDAGEKALAAFVSRFGRRVDAAQWARGDQIGKAVEALKSWRDRHQQQGGAS